MSTSQAGCRTGIQRSSRYSFRGKVVPRGCEVRLRSNDRPAPPQGRHDRRRSPRNPGTQTLRVRLDGKSAIKQRSSTQSRSSALALPDMGNRGAPTRYGPVLRRGDGSGGFASSDGSGRRRVAGERSEKGSAGAGVGRDIKMHSVGVCHGHQGNLVAQSVELLVLFRSGRPWADRAHLAYVFTPGCRAGAPNEHVRHPEGVRASPALLPRSLYAHRDISWSRSQFSAPQEECDDANCA